MPKIRNTAHLPGYVYVIQNGKYSKIGRTVNVSSRIDSLRYSIPSSLTLLASFAVDDMACAEWLLHQHFLKKRLRGEWFALNKTDMKWILSRIWEQSLLTTHTKRYEPIALEQIIEEVSIGVVVEYHPPAQELDEHLDWLIRETL